MISRKRFMGIHKAMMYYSRLAYLRANGTVRERDKAYRVPDATWYGRRAAHYGRLLLSESTR